MPKMKSAHECFTGSSRKCLFSLFSPIPHFGPVLSQCPQSLLNDYLQHLMDSNFQSQTPRCIIELRMGKMECQKGQSSSLIGIYESPSILYFTIHKHFMVIIIFISPQGFVPQICSSYPNTEAFFISIPRCMIL